MQNAKTSGKIFQLICTFCFDELFCHHHLHGMCAVQSHSYSIVSSNFFLSLAPRFSLSPTLFNPMNYVTHAQKSQSKSLRLMLTKYHHRNSNQRDGKKLLLLCLKIARFYLLLVASSSFNMQETYLIKLSVNPFF